MKFFITLISAVTCVGCQLTKVCRKQTIYKHYVYWTKVVFKSVDKDFLELRDRSLIIGGRAGAN
jgi:hypothetical protein